MNSRSELDDAIASAFWKFDTARLTTPEIEAFEALVRAFYERGKFDGLAEATRNVARYFEAIAAGQTPQEVIETAAIHFRLGRSGDDRD